MIEMAIKDDITWRTIIVYVFIVLFGCLILAKACAVMTVEGEKWRKMASANVPVQPVKIEPNRGVLSFCFSLPSFQQSIIIGLAVYIPPLHPAWLT